MDLIVNYGNEAYILPEPTETVTFVGRPGKDGIDGILDTGILINYLTKLEANDRFTLLQSSIEMNAELIKLTVSRTEFDLLGNKLNQLETSINQTALSITLLATKSEVDRLTGRVNQAEASLQVTANALTLKASQSSVDNLGNRLTTAEGTLTVQANLIAARVTKTEFDAFGNQVGQRFSSIEQTATSITQTVQGLPTKEYVNSQLATIPYNGLNLYNNSTPLFYNASSLNARTDSGFNITGIPQNTGEVRLSGVIKENGPYTISFYARAPISIQLGVDFCDGTNIPFTINNDLRYYQFTQTVTNYSNIYNFIDIKGLGNQIHYFDKIKVERGSRATEWTPDVGDLTQVINTYNTRITQVESSIQLLATKNTTDLLGNRLATAEGQLTIQAGLIESKVSLTTYNTLNQKVGTLETTVSQQAGQIASKVSQTNFDVLSGRMSNAESSILQTQSQISSKVSMTDYTGNVIASLINQTSTTIKLQASKILLDGAVTANSLESGRTRINRNPEGDFEFLHANGKLAFRMTTLEDGKAVFQAFNDAGVKVFDIDTVSRDGIKYVTVIPDTFDPYQINRIGNYTVNDPVGTELNTLLANARAMFTYTSAEDPMYTKPYQNVTISRLSQPNAYYYTAGVYDGSDANVQYNGYHTSNTNGSPYISDGWYTGDDRFIGMKLSGADWGSANPQTGTINMFAVVSGKVVSNKTMSITI